jgi:hypothetical protein
MWQAVAVARMAMTTTDLAKSARQHFRTFDTSADFRSIRGEMATTTDSAGVGDTAADQAQWKSGQLDPEGGRS